MRLLDKVFSSEKPAHNEAIKEIERDFNLRVVDREAILRLFSFARKRKKKSGKQG